MRTTKRINRVLKKIFPVKFQNKYIIPNQQSNAKKELNM